MLSIFFTCRGGCGGRGMRVQSLNFSVGGVRGMQLSIIFFRLGGDGCGGRGEAVAVIKFILRGGGRDALIIYLFVGAGWRGGGDGL